MTPNHFLCLLCSFNCFFSLLLDWSAFAQEISPVQEEPVAEPQEEVGEEAGESSNSDARSDTLEAAKRHFFTGVKLLETENYEGAKTEFEEAIALHPSTSAFFNLANCYEAMHRYREAFAVFEYLEKSYAGGLGPDLEQAIGRHKRNILKVAAQLLIQVNLTGAIIKVDNESVGISPIAAPFLYSPGQVIIEVSREGYVTQRRKVKLVSKETTSVLFELKPILTGLSIHVNQVGAVISVNGEKIGHSPLEQRLALPPGAHEITVEKDGFERFGKRVMLDPNRDKVVEVVLSQSQRIGQVSSGKDARRNWVSKISPLSWIGLGLTLVSGTTDGILWYLAVKKSDKYQRIDDTFSEDYLSLKSYERDARKKERDDAKADASRFNAAAIAVGIGTGVFAITTTILTILDLKRNKANRGRKVTFLPTIGGVGGAF